MRSHSLPIRVAMLMPCLLCAAAWLSAQDVRPRLARDGFGEREQQICRAVFATLQQRHLGPAPMPAELERDVIDKFLNKLDSRKMYFLQADIDAARAKSQGLAKQLRAGDLTLVSELYDVYRLRVAEQTALGRKLLQESHDFNADDTVNIGYGALPYCATEGELGQRWRMWMKYQLLTLKLPDEELAVVRRRIDARYQRIAADVESWHPDDLLELFLTSLAECFDPHSSYLSAKTVDGFNS